MKLLLAEAVRIGALLALVIDELESGSQNSCINRIHSRRVEEESMVIRVELKAEEFRVVRIQQQPRVNADELPRSYEFTCEERVCQYNFWRQGEVNHLRAKSPYPCTGDLPGVTRFFFIIAKGIKPHGGLTQFSGSQSHFFVTEGLQRNVFR